MNDQAALPERDSAKTNTQQGLYRKFEVRRTDGSDFPGGKHNGCDYFVLDMTHDPHAKAAAAAYADSAEMDYPDLAADMRGRYGLATLTRPAGGDEVVDVPGTEEGLLRALAQNYGEGPHRLVRVDRDACLRAADEIKALREALYTKPQQPRQEVVDAVLAMVRDEIKRATAKFPTWPTDPLHASGVVQEEAGELAKAVLQAVYEPHKSTPDAVVTEAFQTAAMAVRFLMSMTRYDWTPGVQHRQE